MNHLLNDCKPGKSSRSPLASAVRTQAGFQHSSKPAMELTTAFVPQTVEHFWTAQKPSPGSEDRGWIVCQTIASKQEQWTGKERLWVNQQFPRCSGSHSLIGFCVTLSLGWMTTAHTASSLANCHSMKVLTMPFCLAHSNQTTLEAKILSLLFLLIPSPIPHFRSCNLTILPSMSLTAETTGNSSENLLCFWLVVVSNFAL